MSETLATLLEDGSEGARNEAASALGTLMRMVGERPLNPILDGLADVRKAKIKEAYEKATVKCKASTPGSMPKPAPAPSAAAPKKKTPSTKPPPPAEEEAPAPTKAVSKPPARLMVGQLLPHVKFCFTHHQCSKSLLLPAHRRHQQRLLRLPRKLPLPLLQNLPNLALPLLQVH